MMNDHTTKMAKTSLSTLIDNFEELCDSSTKLPIVNKVAIDREQVYELIDKMRLALPESLRDAERIASDRERWIGEAKEEARRRIEAAEQQVNKLVRESEIVRQAEEQAGKIIAEAKQMAKEMKAGAVEYADAALSSLEDDLEKMLRSAKKGREELKKRGA